MQIVIDIDDKVYGLLKYFEEGMGLNDKEDDSDDVKTALMRAVIHGTPLPKGHGDIIDRSKIEYIKAIYDLKWGKIAASECATKIKYSAPTIIEADTNS